MIQEQAGPVPHNRRVTCVPQRFPESVAQSLIFRPVRVGKQRRLFLEPLCWSYVIFRAVSYFPIGFHDRRESLSHETNWDPSTAARKERGRCYVRVDLCIEVYIYSPIHV